MYGENKDGPLVMIVAIAVTAVVFVAMAFTDKMSPAPKILRLETIRLSNGKIVKCRQATRGKSGLDLAGCEDGNFYLEQTNVEVLR